jgi:hypothetical protein
VTGITSSEVALRYPVSHLSISILHIALVAAIAAAANGHLI